MIVNQLSQQNLYAINKNNAKKENILNNVNTGAKLLKTAALTSGVYYIAKTPSIVNKIDKFLGKYLKTQSGSVIGTLVNKTGAIIEGFASKIPNTIKYKAKKILVKNNTVKEFFRKIGKGGTAAKGKVGLILSGVALLTGKVLSIFNNHAKNKGKIEQKYNV